MKYDVKISNFSKNTYKDVQGWDWGRGWDKILTFFKKFTFGRTVNFFKFWDN